MDKIMEEDHNVQTVTGFKQRLPKLHKDILLISLKNYKQIKKTYSAVLGLNAIDHLSVNVVNPSGEMVFLSSTPYTGINVCGGIFGVMIHLYTQILTKIKIFTGGKIVILPT